MIIETFKESGVPIEELFAAGGIAEKNPFVMQIYADVTNMDIKISGSPQAPALGSAIFGALAAVDDLSIKVQNNQVIGCQIAVFDSARFDDNSFFFTVNAADISPRKGYQLMLLKLQVGSQHFFF